MRNAPKRFAVLICAASEQPGLLPAVVVYPQLPPRSNLTVNCYVADTRLLDLGTVVLGFLGYAAQSWKLNPTERLDVTAMLDVDATTFYAELAPLLGLAVAVIEVPRQFGIDTWNSLENTLPKAVSRAKYYRSLQLQARGEGG